MVQDVAAGQYGQALVRLDSPAALFFKRLGIVPATIEYLLGYDSRIPALFFSIFSVPNVINQGAFDEGWRVPFEYLWHAEHLLLLVWTAAVASWLVHLGRGLHSRTVRLPLVAVLLIYGALVVSSTMVEAFVVYVRTARPLVPFLCLITAAAFEDVRTSSRRSVRMLMPLVLALVVAQAALTFSRPLRQWFPATFLEAAEDAGHNQVAGVRTVYTNHVYPVPEPFALPAGYAVLEEAPHPLQYFPYQYEGYDPAQRRMLRSTDIRMQVTAPAPE